MSRDHDLEILNALARALSHSLEIEPVLHAALDTLAELLRLDTGWAWLLDEATEAPRLAAARNLPPGLAERPELMEGPCHCLTTFAAGDLRGAANVNVVWCSRLAKLVAGGNELRCHASVPLYADDRRLGLLNVASADWRELSADELNLLYTVGAMVSLAIQRTRLAAAEERNRLARDIHDTLAQSLAAIAMQLESADAMVESRDAEPAAEPIRRALALTRATLEEARRSVLGLRAAPLAGRHLLDAIRSLGDELHGPRDRRPRVVVEGSGLARGLPGAVEAGLYHIAREALTNAARHAGATRVTVRVTRRGARVRMRIADDGVGLDPARIPPGRFGLVGMSERARLLGGALTVRGAARRGTTVDVEVPLQAGRSRTEGAGRRRRAPSRRASP
ncbi:MAG TPA: GAF domain-containing sensor histidine kinase [Gemmatimonadaceae bacterium]|nr:GAF domain-containing sensor histidine kinase [Gemmatimonadaceae bacterium]